MIPKLRYNSPVILTFSLICILVLFIPMLRPIDASGEMSSAFGYLFVADKGFSSISDYLTLITYIFGHADEAHLLGNLTFILLLGPIVEEKYGGASLSLMIIVTAIVTALVHIFLFPNTGLLGASGIVFMLIILVSFTNVHRGQIPVTFLLVAVLFIGKEVMESIEADNISQLAHIIGGVCGGIFGFTIGKPKQIDTYA